MSWSILVCGIQFKRQSFKMGPGISLFTILSIAACQALVLVHNAPRKVVKILTVNNGGPWGTWHAPVFCAADSFASGYNMKVRFLHFCFIVAMIVFHKKHYLSRMSLSLSVN